MSDSEAHTSDLIERRRVAMGSAVASTAALIGFISIYVVTLTFGNEAARFPAVVSIVGGAGAFIVLVGSLLTIASSGGVHPPDAHFNWTDAVVSYGGPPLYGALVYILGFWAGSFLGILGLLFALGERRIIFGLAVAGGTLLLIYIVFDLGFSIHMPGSYLYDVLMRK